MFWRDSMLSELPKQTMPQWHTFARKASSANESSDAMAEDARVDEQDGNDKDRATGRYSHLLTVPIPYLAASPNFPRQLLEELVQPCQHNQSGTFTLPIVINPRDHPSRQTVTSHTIQYQLNGISMLVKSAAVSYSLCSNTRRFELTFSSQYESGPSPLAAWVPKSQMKQLASLLSSPT